MEGYTFVLIFFGLVPWLLVLNRVRTVAGAAASALTLCVIFVAAIFAWFGFAIAVYSAGAAAAGLLVLLLSAPLLQPQFLPFAVARHIAADSYGHWGRAIAGACAYVGAEWLFPKLLGDTLAHGLYPSPLLRQCVDIAGTAGASFVLVIVNECVALAITRRRDGARAVAVPIAVAATIIAAMYGYGAARLSPLTARQPAEKPVRVALIQSNIAGYERLRREMGNTYDAVRYVLDTHYAMSREAIRTRDVDALLWSETVYPTTFGRPKSEAGGELDRELIDFVAGTGIPLVFGSYDRDEQGEYNAAVFLEPSATPRFDVYRKTHLFLFTEYMPRWLDNDMVRSFMPWAGTWQPGDGPRVLPLRLRDGRQIPVLPLICLDDIVTGMAIEGAQAGARLILTMSNDSWFSEHPDGARLHLVVSAYRSIETRLAQLRVTANGISAVIDRTGEIVARAGMGERAILAAEAPVDALPPTLVVTLGDPVGPLALVVLAAMLALPKIRERRGGAAPDELARGKR